MTNLIGHNLGPYRVLEQVGRGGMATVYKAYQPAMDRYVAVKVLPAHFMQDPTFVERFEREARTIARLEHPHILPVHDYGKTSDGTTYIVMRYIEAGTLSDLLRRGSLSLNKVIDLFSQIGDALAYAHEQGVIHRDMKPSNVLVDPRGQAFLTDFGLARMVEGDSNLTGSMVVGTPTYMAPEQGQGRPADIRSDIYSLGIILYEMVTGRPPFEAETPMAVMIKHMTEPLPLPSQLNPELLPAVERVILKALAKEPDARYQAVADMTKALQEAVTEPPTLLSVPRATLTADRNASLMPTEASFPAQRRPWLTPVLVGIALLLIISGIGLAFFLSRFSSQGQGVGGVVQATSTPVETLPEDVEEPSNPIATSPETDEAIPAPTEESSLSTFAASPGWTHFSNTMSVRALAAQSEFIWVGTEGGLLAWNRLEGSYQKYTTLDGLADHYILALLVAADNTLWAGTEGAGVLRFDGASWQDYNPDTGLTGYEVPSLFEMDDDTLLAGTLYGDQAISQFDGANWRAADFPTLPVDFPKPIAFAQDPAGRLVIGLSEEGGLLYLDGDQWQHITSANGLPSNSINGLAYDAAGNLWLVTNQPGGIGIFADETFSASPELANTTGTVLYATPDGALWLGTDYDGLWYFDGQSWDRYGEDERLRSGYITSILQDDDGLLWLGYFEQGLLTFDGQIVTAWTLENEPAFNSAQQILAADDGQLWFVEKYGGPEIAIYHPDADSWEALPTPGHTQVVAFDPDGSLWFGANDGLWHVTTDGSQQRFSTSDGLPGDNITALTFNSAGGLWVGTETGLVYHQPADVEVPWRDFTGYIPSPYVTSLHTDPNGQVWIGVAAADGRPAGLAWAEDDTISGMWLAGDDLPEALQPVQDSIAGHPFPPESESITALATDASGNLWVGAWNGGLWRFTPDSGEWRLFGASDGAPASNILSIAVDNAGTVWFGTWYEGLWAFNEAWGWRQTGTDGGLPGHAIFASYVAPDGSLWLATESGLARYVPE
jgi:serine/threonine protein kinase/ligand-binding sensor domain-containing protein